MRKSLLFLLIPLLFACSKKDDLKVPEESEMPKVAAPLTLQTDSTHVILSDYFVHPNHIDSVKGDPALGFNITADSSEMILFTVNRNLPKLSVLNIWADGFQYTLLIRKNPKIWAHFSFNPEKKNFKHVSLAGDMNDWIAGKDPMKLKDGKWETDVLVNPGKYQYKFVTDGKWISDPANNERSGSNSVVYIGNVHPQAAPVLYTVSSDKKSITLGRNNKIEKLFVMWQNHLLDSSFYKIDSTITIKIPQASSKYDNSVLRVYALNATGISNEILVPLKDGKVVLATSDLQRTDPHAMVMYFMMIDRFMNGDTTNDAPVADKEVDPRLNYMGGDITGIQKKLDDGYFKDLGVNTLWISPVTQNPKDAWKEYPAPHRKYSGYHGYWPIYLTTVDNRYGTADELKDLVKEIHSKDMNILLDYVSNHVHQESPLYKAHPDWVTQLNLAGGKKNIRLWNEQRLTTWFDEFLPTLDLSKKEVYEMVSDSALFMLTNYGFDGFRHDAAKHIPEIYWRTLTGKIKDKVVKEEKRDVYQIGESFGSRELINSYINPGMLDAQFDFSVFFDAESVFAGNTSMKNLSNTLNESFFYFGNHHVMGNISGNQDLPRFISYASGAISPDEDANAVGWKRDIEVKDTVGYSKLAMFLAFNMTIPGVPVIYYGDEFGMPGAGDPDNRRMMRFENLFPQEIRMMDITKRLVKLRRESMPLLYGDFTTLSAGENTMIYMRTYFDKVAFVIFNNGKSVKKVTFELPSNFAKAELKNNFGNNFKIEGNKVNIDLKPNSFEILTN